MSGWNDMLANKEMVHVAKFQIWLYFSHELWNKKLNCYLLNLLPYILTCKHHAWPMWSRLEALLLMINVSFMRTPPLLIEVYKESCKQAKNSNYTTFLLKSPNAILGKTNHNFLIPLVSSTPHKNHDRSWFRDYLSLPPPPPFSLASPLSLPFSLPPSLSSLLPSPLSLTLSPLSLWLIYFSFHLFVNNPSWLEVHY